MSQVTQMLKETNKIMRDLDNNPDSFNPSQIDRRLRTLETQVKILNTVISAYAVASKNKRMLASMKNQNILDDTSAVDLMLGDPEVAKVKCPEQDDLITRSECLDYSGEEKNFVKCEGCEIGLATKRLLLDK